MKHQATVTKSPTGPPLDLIPHKTIFRPKTIVGEGFFKKEMTKGLLEFGIGFRICLLYTSPSPRD